MISAGPNVPDLLQTTLSQVGVPGSGTRKVKYERTDTQEDLEWFELKMGNGFTNTEEAFHHWMRVVKGPDGKEALMVVRAPQSQIDKYQPMMQEVLSSLRVGA